MRQVFGGQVAAFAKFKESGYDLDSFLGLQMDSIIPKARVLLKVMEPSEVERLTKLLLEYGDCITKNFNENNFEELKRCEYAPDLKYFMDKVMNVPDQL
jgi:hypothetical protein